MVLTFSKLEIASKSVLNHTLNGMLECHGWTTDANVMPKEPVHPDSIHKLLVTVGSTNVDKIEELELKFGFSCHQVLGEAVFAMVVGTFDTSHAMSVLSTKAAAPAACHFIALKKLWRWMRHNKTTGLLYWHLQPRLDLDIGPDKVEGTIHPNFSCPSDPFHGGAYI